MAALQFKTEEEARAWLKRVKASGEKPADESISLNDFIEEPTPEAAPSRGSVPPKAMPSEPPAVEEKREWKPAEPIKPRSNPVGVLARSTLWIAQIVFQIYWWMLIDSSAVTWGASEWWVYLFGAIVIGSTISFFGPLVVSFLFGWMRYFNRWG